VSLWVGMQMLVGGILLVPVATAAGELARFDPTGISVRSVLALAYLIVFGSLVALLLGWALAQEPLTFRSVVAAAIIVGSVVLITTERPRAEV